MKQVIMVKHTTTTQITTHIKLIKILYLQCSLLMKTYIQVED